MNVVITLPRDLIDKIISGEKKYELRKSDPSRLLPGDGFFVIEKGTDRVRCFCRAENIYSVQPWEARACGSTLGVSDEWVREYCKNAHRLYLWKIGKVFEIVRCSRSQLCLKKNPQSFAYTPRHLSQMIVNY